MKALEEGDGGVSQMIGIGKNIEKATSKNPLENEFLKKTKDKIL